MTPKLSYGSWFDWVSPHSSILLQVAYSRGFLSRCVSRCSWIALANPPSNPCFFSSCRNDENSRFLLTDRSILCLSPWPPSARICGWYGSFLSWSWIWRFMVGCRLSLLWAMLQVHLRDWVQVQLRKYQIWWLNPFRRLFSHNHWSNFSP